MTSNKEFEHAEITEAIIKEAYYVHNVLGFGFLVSVYENALYDRLCRQGWKTIKQPPIKVFFEKQEVGFFFADLVVEDKVIVELKAVKSLHKIHEAQLVNYLKATDLTVGLLINFGHSVSIRRRVHSNKLRLRENQR
jgi:GxxExxY protein